MTVVTHNITGAEQGFKIQTDKAIPFKGSGMFFLRNIFKIEVLGNEILAY